MDLGDEDGVKPYYGPRKIEAIKPEEWVTLLKDPLPDEPKLKGTVSINGSVYTITLNGTNLIISCMNCNQVVKTINLKEVLCQSSKT